MISYTKFNVYNIILIVTIIIFIVLNILIDSVINLNNVKVVKVENNIGEAKELKEDIRSEITNEEDSWTIEIKAINLKADIAEGTTEEVMNEYVGHFENTEFWNGNVGLAAHNRRISCKLFWKT